MGQLSPTPAGGGDFLSTRACNGARRRPAHFFPRSLSFQSRPSRGTRHSPPVDSVTLKINKGFTPGPTRPLPPPLRSPPPPLPTRLLSALPCVLARSFASYSPVPGTSTARVDRSRRLQRPDGTSFYQTIMQRREGPLTRKTR